MPRNINQAGLAMIKSFEGLRLDAYQDSADIWTIGYGHTRGVQEGMSISEADAMAFLEQDIAGAGAFVDTATADVATGENQFAAMVSLCFNIGSGNFKTSSVLRRHREGDDAAVADAFLLWDKAHVDGELVELDGLRNRREAERTLYLTADA
jgi:lysozyme